MNRKRILTFTGVTLALLSCALAGFVWSPALSAAGACRTMMQHIEGYGPWRAEGLAPVSMAQVSGAVLSYFDGVNTATCHAKQYGPVWIVAGVGQTMVGCSRGLSADPDQQCPRRMYGVIP